MGGPEIRSLLASHNIWTRIRATANLDARLYLVDSHPLKAKETLAFPVTTTAEIRRTLPSSAEVIISNQANKTKKREKQHNKTVLFTLYQVGSRRRAFARW